MPHRTPSQAVRSRQLTPLLRSLSRSHLRRMSPQRRTYIDHQPICMIITAGGRLQTSCANISTLYPCHAPTNTTAAVCGGSLQISAACKMKYSQVMCACSLWSQSAPAQNPGEDNTRPPVSCSPAFETYIAPNWSPLQYFQ